MIQTPVFKAMLFDTGGVLYHRPRADEHLKAFLQQHGLTLRHRSVLEKALRAARFDALTGRITRETFYDGILRVNGVEDESLFPAGREAIYQDAVDIELFPGVAATLNRLHEAGMLLATVSDTAHTASEKIAWLATHGISPGVWSAFVVSRDVGMTKARPAIFAHTLKELGVSPGETGFVGHATEELASAKEAGLTTIAFLPDEYAVNADYEIGAFYELIRLASGRAP